MERRTISCKTSTPSLCVSLSHFLTVSINLIKPEGKEHLLINLSLVGLYPLLRKFKINFSPVLRIFAGFLLVSISMVYSSVLQHYIYISPPKSIHVWIQAPAYIFVAFSEAFVIVTGLELAFTHAPKK